MHDLEFTIHNMYALLLMNIHILNVCETLTNSKKNHNRLLINLFLSTQAYTDIKCFTKLRQSRPVKVVL